MSGAARRWGNCCGGTGIRWPRPPSCLRARHARPAPRRGPGAVPDHRRRPRPGRWPLPASRRLAGVGQRRRRLAPVRLSRLALRAGRRVSRAAVAVRRPRALRARAIRGTGCRGAGRPRVGLPRARARAALAALRPPRLAGRAARRRPARSCRATGSRSWRTASTRCTSNGSMGTTWRRCAVRLGLPAPAPLRSAPRGDRLRHLPARHHQAARARGPQPRR